MLTALKVEDINPVDYRTAALWRMIGGQKRLVPCRAWCAQITGTDPTYGLAREFLRPSVDYSKANSQGTRGVFRFYWLEDGIYEVSSPASWRNTERYFCRVENGQIVRISKAEVLECLSAR